MSDDTAPDNNVKKLLRLMISQKADLERTFQQLLTERYLDTAIGAQLDIIGRLVGQRRNGLGDDLYRRYCRARVAANRSRGIVENIIKVAALVLADPAAVIHIEQQGIASFVLRVEDLATPYDVAGALIRFLLDAALAGVRPILEFSSNAPASWFKLDVSHFDSGGHMLTAYDKPVT